MEPTVRLLVEYLRWTLDLIDMYEQRLIQLGDSPELVRSAVHMDAKQLTRAMVEEAHVIVAKAREVAARDECPLQYCANPLGCQESCQHRRGQP